MKGKQITQDEFVNRAKQLHGDKYDYSKSIYTRIDKNITITCRLHGDFLQTPHSHLKGHGCPICANNLLKRIKYGVGINDFNGNLQGDVLRAYRVWTMILERCYSEKLRYKHKSYKGCTICDEWKHFSNFYSWWCDNYVEGFTLDKDIIVKGNKIYSPQTCCFVPQEINAFFTRNDARREDMPIGVNLFKNGKYVARINNGNGEYKHLGYFNSKESAFLEYKAAKEKRARSLANEWKNEISKDVFDVLNNYVCDPLY